MAETIKRPILTVVDYDAWEKGYMPPSEHVLIDQLSYRGAKVRMMVDHGDEGAFWIVERPGSAPDEMRAHMRDMIALWFKDKKAVIPEGHSAPLDDRTTAEMMADRDQTEKPQ
jgi:hypothetical protein